MIIEYRLNLDQGKDQAQLKWPLPLTSARNRASDVHSSSLSSLWDSGSWFCLRFSESRRWLPHYLKTTIKSGLFSKTTCLSMIFWRGTHHHRSRVPSIRISVCAISLRKECDSHIENFGEITSDYILQLAEKYDYITRKWLIHPER